MKQQVNLLNALPQTQRDFFSARILTKVLGVFVVFLFIVYGFGYWGSISLNKKATALKIKHSETADELVALTKKYPKAANYSKLENEVKALEKQTKARARLAEILKKQGAFNTSGFSEYLVGLGKSVVPGVWLTEFTLSNGGASVGLEGRALNAQLVLGFVKQLNDSKEFKNISFKVGNLKKIGETEGLVEFSLKGAKVLENA